MRATLICQSMKFGKPMVFFSALLISVLQFGCKPSESVSSSVSPEEGGYKVVCTVGMITDVVRNIVGDYAAVEGIIGEGVDPHLYKPTRGDVVKLSNANVVFYNGLLLEGKMTDVLEAVARRGKPVKAVTELILISPDYLMNKEDGSGHTDPHVWMDVAGWLQAVPIITETLLEYDPDRTADYLANGAVYINELKELDAYAKRVLATIPESQRVLVTAHDAFRYLGRAYGIEVKGIQGLSTESEAGVRDLEELVDFIVERKIPAVFVESSVADKNVRALVEGAKARGHQVEIGGELFSDAMGEPGTYEGTYIGMIDHNVTTIARALGGVAEGFRIE